MNNPSYFDAVQSLVGGILSGPTNGPIAGFFFDNNPNRGDKEGYTLPTESEIQAESTRLQAAYDAQAYARSRQAEYPPLEDQLDHIYHNGIASWKANMVKPVKDKYPKPG